MATPCTGSGILVSKISNMLRDSNSVINVELKRFHDLLEADVENIANLIQEHKTNSVSLYEVICTILVNWIHRKSSNATIGTLRSVLKELGLMFLAEQLEEPMYGKHICDKCRVVEKINQVVKRQQAKCTLLKTDFNVIRVLGSGGFGAVLECQNKHDKHRYAIKVAPGDDPEGIREVENMVKIPKHKNIVHYNTCWKEEFTQKELQDITKILGDSVQKFMLFVPGQISLALLCIQMELCSGDLRTWLRKQGTVDLTKVVNIFQQAICGIQHIHKQGLIHRDIKPENIFFDLHDPSVVKIGDMGIAVGHTSMKTIFHTQGVGTKLYLAPEQKGEKYGPSVDIYASGIILMELLDPSIQSTADNASNDKLIEAVDALTIDKTLPEIISATWPKLAELILGMVARKNRPDCDTILEKISDFDMQSNSAAHSDANSSLISSSSSSSSTIVPDEQANKSVPGTLSFQTTSDQTTLKDSAPIPITPYPLADQMPFPTFPGANNNYNAQGQGGNHGWFLQPTALTTATSNTKAANPTPTPGQVFNPSAGECANCSKKLAGARFKCTECEDYNLCTTCMNTPNIIVQLHKDKHTFQKINWGSGKKETPKWDKFLDALKIKDEEESLEEEQEDRRQKKSTKGATTAKYGNSNSNSRKPEAAMVASDAYFSSGNQRNYVKEEDTSSEEDLSLEDFADQFLKGQMAMSSNLTKQINRNMGGGSSRSGMGQKSSYRPNSYSVVRCDQCNRDRLKVFFHCKNCHNFNYCQECFENPYVSHQHREDHSFSGFQI